MGSMRRRLAGAGLAAFVLVVLAWMAAVGWLWTNEPRLVFRTTFSQRAAGTLAPGLQPLAIRTADGLSLDAARLEYASTDARFWLIYFQGNAGSLRRGRVQRQLQQLHALGYNVLSLDYRGYGRSEGTPSEQGLYEDGLAAHAYLLARGVPSSRIILAGQSLGSAVAVEVAIRRPSAGLVLFSPLDSVPRAAERIYPWAPVEFLARNRFDSVAKMRRVQVPLLVFHSERDRLIPLPAARALVALAAGSTRMVETGGGHNGAGFAEPEALREALWRFWPPPPGTLERLE
ncbi:MAG: alpha/beta hydrolase [Vicinamibacterales bacterium]